MTRLPDQHPHAESDQTLLGGLWSRFWPSRLAPEQARNTAQMRLIFAGALAITCFAGIGAKAFHLATVSAQGDTEVHVRLAGADRGAIYDRNGRVLAQTVPVMTLHADPKQVLDPYEVAEKLSAVLPELTKQDILAALSRKTRYVELNRKITPRRHAAILGLGLPGIFITPSNLRTYPNGAEAAHILGQVNRDGLGIAGIEKSMQATLSAGRDVTLSVDLGVQAVVRRALAEQIKTFEALGGTGLVSNIKTGEVIAIVSLPDYDPNQYAVAAQKALFNQATKGVFEMGSIFKVLNTAIALEAGSAQLSSSYDVTRPLRIGGFPIRDYHPYDRFLNLSEVLVYSSNIGSARIAEEIGPEVQRGYMEKLGLLGRPALELTETARPLYPSSWGRLSSYTISFGHGISVSPVHVMGAIGAAAGDGEFIAPTLLKRSPGEVIERVRIFSSQTTRKVRSMMRLVVSHKDGTANFAEAPGYLVGAKTGTAEKVKGKRYDKRANLVSVVAAFPIHDPEYLVFVMVDEPQPQKHSHGYATAGWVAAPVIADIVNRIAPILNVHPVDINQPEIRQNLEPDLRIGGKGAIRASY